MENQILLTQEGIDVEQRLSPHFTLREMVMSSTCLRNNAINYMDNPPVIIARLKTLCEQVLEPLRLRFGPVVISSGYRSQFLNYAVGGAKDSQHRKGEAADLYTPSREILSDYFEFIRHELDFDQLIVEENRKSHVFWLHVSYTTRRPNRRQMLNINK